MDYAGLYEDLLAMERRAKERGLTQFAESCRQFRVDILMLCKTFAGRVVIA